MVSDIDVVGAASDGQQALDLARREQPDVLLMDIRMPRMDGIEATRRICADPSCAGVRTIILTTFDLDEHVYGALAAGASGFWSRTPHLRRSFAPSGWSPAGRPCWPPPSPRA